MNVLATDIGYGHTKYAMNGVLDKFPSIVAPVYGTEKNKYGDSNAVEYNGKRYLVAEDGQLANNIIITNTENFLLRYAPVLLYKVFEKSNIKKIDTLCVSLSIAEFHEKKAKMQKICESFVINGTEYKQNVSVYPQGVGIWVDVGKPTNAIVIDIGFNTIDVITFLQGKPIKDFSFGLINQGVCNITSTISEYINEKFSGTYLGPDFANEILLNGGKFNFFRRQYDISDFLNDVKNDYAENIMTMVLTNPKIQQIANRIDSYIIAGGGAYYIDKTVQKKYALIIPERPEYSNVRGFLKEAENGK